MAPPHALTSLTTREAMTDAVYRLFRAFDLHDTELFDSAFHLGDEEVVFEVNNGGARTAKGVSDIRSQFFDLVGPMDTTHIVSNMRVDVGDGAQTGSLSAFGMAQHCPPGRGREPDGPKYVGGAEYLVDLKLGSDGLWKIEKLVVNVLWAQGDVSVLQS